MKRIGLRSATTALALVLFPVTSYSIYETDDRHDLYRYPLNSVARHIAQGVALMTIQKNIFTGDTGQTQIRTQLFSGYQIKIEEPLCTGERFQSQPVTIEKAGTGFLVAPDLLITAGHVIENNKECEESAIVFGYGYFEPWSDLSIVAETELYRCKEVIYTQNNSGGDIALIRLDRKVPNRVPLTVRREGKTVEGTPLWMAGHPLTLPLKITENGILRSILDPAHFFSTLDTYGGNSGSPVFNPATGLVEGVLIEGESTEITLKGEFPSGCWYSKVYCDKTNLDKLRCDDTEYTGAKSTRIELLWKYLP